MRAHNPHAGIDDLLVLDRTRVGASFEAWPDETRFITPSFPTNSIGMLDLNSVAIGTSPAATLGVEHPTGKQFASYLRRLAAFFELPIVERTDVLGVTEVDDEFQVRIAEGAVRSRHVVWAAGEFQYPRRSGLPDRKLVGRERSPRTLLPRPRVPERPQTSLAPRVEPAPRSMRTRFPAPGSASTGVRADHQPTSLPPIPPCPVMLVVTVRTPRRPRTGHIYPPSAEGAGLSAAKWQTNPRPPKAPVHLPYT